MNKSMEEIHWWHQVPLNDGRFTPGMVPIYQHEKTYLFNEVDFHDKSVLDIGAWDGYFSFSAERRGAKRVVALDNPDFRWGGLDGFNFLHNHFNSSVEWKKGTIYELPEEVFDVVLCYGVLYHLSDPLLALTNCFQRSSDLVLVEGLLFESEKPELLLLEPMFANDRSNVYTMSTGYVAMIGRLNGFELVKHAQAAVHRGAMLFKANGKMPCPYKETCFPFPPAEALDGAASSAKPRPGTAGLRLSEMVRAAYRELLGRIPEGEPERGTALAESGGLGAVFSGIAQSPEFKERQARQLAPAFLRSARLTLLGLDAEPAGMDPATQGDTTGVDTTAALQQLVESGEYQRKVFLARVPELVKAAYRALLGREPDAAGERAYTAFLANKRDVTAFLLDITGSEEFKKKQLARLKPEPVKEEAKAQGEPQRKSRSPESRDGVGRDALDDGEEPQEALLFDDGFPERPLTRAAIRAAFSLILGRPATEGDVEAHLSAETAGTLRAILLQSEEFSHNMARLSPTAVPAAADIEAMKTVFLHIPKTGGTTMRELLRPSFEPGQLCPERFDGLHCYKAAQLAQFRLFAGHLRLQSCALIPGPKRLVTMLRRPVDRLVSFYNFNRAHSQAVIKREDLWRGQLARDHLMPEFFSLEKIRHFPPMNNCMVRLLAQSPPGDFWGKEARIEGEFNAMDLLDRAKKSLWSLLVFGILERYGESVELIFDALGLEPPSSIEPKNVLKEIAGSSPNIERTEPQECGPETLEIIAPLVEADTALYNYGVELFQERLEALRRRRGKADAPERPQ